MDESGRSIWRNVYTGIRIYARADGGPGGKRDAHHLPLTRSPLDRFPLTARHPRPPRDSRSRPVHIPSRCSPSPPRWSSSPPRSRIRRTSCSSRPPTCTATRPTGTTWPIGRSPAGWRGSPRWWTRSARAIPGQVVLVDAGDLLQGDPFATYFARVAPDATPHPIVEAMNLTGYDAATPGQSRLRLGRVLLPAGRRRGALSLCERQPRTPGAATRSCFPPGAWCSAKASASRSPASPRPGTMVWDREQLGGAAHQPDPGRGGAGARGHAAGRRRHRRAGALAGWTGARPTTRPASATKMSRPASRGSRRGPTSSSSVTRTARCGIRWSTACTSCSPARSARASRWSTSISPARTASGASGGSAPTSSRRVTSRPPRCWPNVWRPIATRCAPGCGRRSGWPPSPCARRPLGSGPCRRSTSSRTCSADGPARRSRPRPRSISGPGSTRTPSAWRTCSRSTHSTTRSVPSDSAVRQLKAYLEWSARYLPGGCGGADRSQRLRARLQLRRRRRRAYDIDLRRPVGDRIQRLGVRGRPVEPTDSFTMAINSYRQTGAGGYDMVRGAPVVYDKGESIVELLIDAVRARSPIDSAELAGISSWRIVPEVADRAVRGSVQRAGAAAPEGRARYGGAPGPRHRRPARALSARRGGARRDARQPRRRVRVPAGPTRRRRRDAGHAGSGRDPRPRGHGSARPAGLRRRGARRSRLRLVAGRVARADRRVAVSLARRQRGGQRQRPPARLDRYRTACSMWRGCGWR